MSKEINFNPYTANVLDYMGREMIATDGRQVMVAQNMRGEFMVYVAGALFENGLSNMVASSVLNRIGCRLSLIELA